MAMTVGELLDQLAECRASLGDVWLEEQWRSMEVTVRGQNELGEDFCGSLRSVSIEEAHGDGPIFLALDASDEPEDDNG